MATPSRAKPKLTLRTLAFLAVAFLIFVGLYVGVPYVLYKIGIGSGYRVGTFRSGSGAYHMPLNVMPDALRELSDGRVRRKRMGLAFAREGEVLHIDADVAPRLGGITLRVTGLIGGGVDPVFRHRFDSTEAVRDSAEFPGTGLYYIRFSFTDFVGEARVRWRVGEAPQAATQ